MDRIIEQESGTYTPRTAHPHNGYYAGDFSSAAYLQLDSRTLLAMTRWVALEVSTSTVCRSVLTPPGPGGHPSVGGS